MNPRFKPGTAALSRTAFHVRLCRLGWLILPLAVLITAGYRYHCGPSDVIWLGVIVQALAGCLLLSSGIGWSKALGLAGVMVYIIALCWLALVNPPADTGFLYVSRASFVLMPLAFFASRFLVESGAEELRRAAKLAERLGNKKRWPEELDACRLLPEVRLLRAALSQDAGPALALLSNPLPQVRVAALGALEGRRQWVPGQPELILHIACHAPEPEVRIAAIYALARNDDRVVVETLATFMCDPDLQVRRAAADAVLDDLERRWSWVREPLRNALAHPEGQNDGPICPSGREFSSEAVQDLTAWACEKGIVALRATLTLGAHADQVLSRGQNEGLVKSLHRQITDVHAPPVLRLELARVLQRYNELDVKVLRALIDPSTPAPLRLIAVETLLTRGDSPEARAALYDIARLPNRELALATAEVLQHRLGVDVGLPRGKPLPPVHSRQAADVARKVQLWSSRTAVADEETSDDSAW